MLFLKEEHFSDDYVDSLQNDDMFAPRRRIIYSELEEPAYVPPWVAPFVAHAKAIREVSVVREDTSGSQSESTSNTV